MSKREERRLCLSFFFSYSDTRTHTPDYRSGQQPHAHPSYTGTHPGVSSCWATLCGCSHHRGSGAAEDQEFWKCCSRRKTIRALKNGTRDVGNLNNFVSHYVELNVFINLHLFCLDCILGDQNHMQ